MQGANNDTPIGASVHIPKEEITTKQQAADKARNKINMYALALGGAKGHSVTVDGKTMPAATAVNKMMKAYRTLSVNESLTKEERALVKERITSLRDAGAISLIDYKILELQRRGASWISKELTKLGYLGPPKEPRVTVEEEKDKSKKEAPSRGTVTIGKEHDVEDDEDYFTLENEEVPPEPKPPPEPEGKGKEKEEEFNPNPNQSEKFRED